MASHLVTGNRQRRTSLELRPTPRLLSSRPDRRASGMIRQSALRSWARAWSIWSKA